jgi:hypothetical protein
MAGRWICWLSVFNYWRTELTKDEIIQAARDAGILSDLELMPQNQWRQDTIRELEIFSALIIAATKEEDARICDELLHSHGADTGGECTEVECEFMVAWKEAADAIRASKQGKS